MQGEGGEAGPGQRMELGTVHRDPLNPPLRFAQGETEVRRSKPAGPRPPQTFVLS